MGDITTYAALGVTHFVFDLVAPDLKGQLALMERFADEVRSRLPRSPKRA